MSFWDGRRYIAKPQALAAPDPPGRVQDWLATAVIVIVGLGLLLPSRGADASSPTLAVTPAGGLPGSRVTLVGQDFPPRAAIGIVFDGAAVGMDVIRVNGNGGIRTAFTVPAALPGLHSITAMMLADPPGAASAVAVTTTTFTVDPPATETVAVTPSPMATIPIAPAPTSTPIASVEATPSPAVSASPLALADAPQSATPAPTATAFALPLPTAQPGNVSVCGRAFCLAGQPWYLHGASVLGGMDDAAATSAHARSAGLNTIRVVNFLDERGAPATAAYDEWHWARLDRIIADASANDLKVILDLSTYRNMLANAGLNPYAEDWGPFVSFAANRRNTVTGVRYGDDPTIALVAIAGEVEPINTPDNRLGVTTSQVTEFFTRTFAQWRSIDAVHPVTSGGLLHYGWNSGIDWQAIFAAADACSIHNYSAGDVAATATVASYCAGMNKPWITEEFGWDISLGDAGRAVAFQSIYDLNRTNGSAGTAFWNLGPQTQMPTYDVNDTTPLTLDVVRRNAR